MSVSMLGENIGQVPNWPVSNPPAFSQLGRNVLNHQPCNISDWRKDPRVLYVRPLIRKHIVSMLRKTNHYSQCFHVDLVTALDNQLFMEASSKEEYLNLSTLCHRSQMVLQRSSFNANSVQQVDDALRASFPFFNTNPSPSLLHIARNPDAGRPLFDSFKKNACSNNTGQFNFMKGHCNNLFELGGADTLMYEARNGTPCSVVIRQAANEALLSTENTSSITINSDVNWNAYSRAASDVQYFPQGEVSPPNFKSHGESSQNSNFNMPLEMGEALILSSSSSLIPQKVSKEILDVSNNFLGMNFSGSYYSMEDSVQVQSKTTDSQMYQQRSHQPPLQSQVPFKESLAVQNFASKGFTSLNISKGLDEQAVSSYVSHFDKCLTDVCCLSGSLNQLNPRKRAIGLLDGLNNLNSGYLEEIVHDSKRLKMESSPYPSKQPNGAEHIALELQDNDQSPASIDSELNQEKMVHLRQPLEDYFTSILDIRLNSVDNDLKQNHETATVFPEESTIFPEESTIFPEEPTLFPEEPTFTEENVKIISDDMWLQWMQEYKKEPCLLGKDGDDVQIKPTELELEAKCIEGTKPQDPKGSFFSEFFRADQIREHLLSLGECMDQSELKGKGGNIENICHLCKQDKIMLAPVPIYCSCCGVRIRHNQSYYCTPDEATQCCFCTSCYKFSRDGNISFNGMCISKEKLCRKKNDEEIEEAWVQCDKCERWQHQVCALYNDQNDLDGKADFICPKCWLKEVENEHYMLGPNTALFSAKDLPKTRLSNHIEKRIFKRLNQERKKRAKATGKRFDEVPGADDLVVRVVLSVDRVSNVKKAFLDVFNGGSYPSEFPYKSKAILLFQKIGGVDVCLFSMYVQEFGSECKQPNQRSVYISYLDSVKHFTPDIQAVTEEPLRTFIYHEILIGYLDFVKKRGFAKCYIWACPPLKGEDYILYCHPESQRTPKSAQLRRWYKSMLRKAAKEKIVVNWSNFYDQFFISTGESNSKITAARLPYFDGDYWLTVAEDVLRKIENESRVDSKKKIKVTKRALKAMGHANRSDYTTKDILLMRKLEEKILPFKDDFIFIRLHSVCMHCHEVIVSGMRWFCDKCPSYQLCERCHDAEPNPYARNKHTSTNKEQHLLSQVMMDNVPSDTKDVDENIENDLFENRSTFLNFCQKNNYQFDTLRRAKHSTTMILHHLRKLCVSAMKKLCSICDKNVVVGKSWICQICPEFNACSTCYQEKSDSCHCHKLIPYSAVIHCDESEFTQQKELLQGSEGA